MGEKTQPIGLRRLSFWVSENSENSEYSESSEPSENLSKTTSHSPQNSVS